MRAKAAQGVKRLVRDIGVPDEVHCHAETVRKCSRHSTADLATLQGCRQQIQTQLVSTNASFKAAKKAGCTCGQQKGCGLCDLHHVCSICRPHGLHGVWLPVWVFAGAVLFKPVAAGPYLAGSVDQQQSDADTAASHPKNLYSAKQEIVQLVSNAGHRPLLLPIKCSGLTLRSSPRV